MGLLIGMKGFMPDIEYPYPKHCGYIAYLGPGGLYVTIEATVTITLLAGIILVIQATITSFNGGEIGTPAALMYTIIRIKIHIRAGV